MRQTDAVARVEIITTYRLGAQRATGTPPHLTLDGDRLVGHGVSGPVHLPADSVGRALWLDAEQTRRVLGPRVDDLSARGGCVVLAHADGRPLVSVPPSLVGGFGLDAEECLELSGLTELAQALGLPVEGAGQRLPDADGVVATLLVDRSQDRRLHGGSLAAAGVALAGGLLAAVATDQGPRPGAAWGPAALAVSLVLTVVLSALLVAGRRRFAAGVSAPPPAEDRLVFPAPTDDPAVSQLQLGRSMVVVWSGGQELRQRGPLARAGVSRCVVTPEVVCFVTRKGRTLLTFRTADLLPERSDHDRLRALCEEVGIAWDGAGTSAYDGGQPSYVGWRFDRQHRPDALMLSPAAMGDLHALTPTALACALLGQAFGVLAQSAARGGGWAWLLVVTALCALALAATRMSIRRWRSAVTAANPRGGRS